MLSYQVYKVVHLWSILVFIVCLTIGLSEKKSPKYAKILIGITTLTILVGGMGLMARLGIEHGGKWPIWLHIKIGLWLVLGVLAPIFLKQLLRFRMVALSFLVGIILMAVWVVVNQHYFI